jgi:hypothetical protein
MEQSMRNGCYSERTSLPALWREESRGPLKGVEIPSASSGQALRFAQDDKRIHVTGF